MGCTLLMFFMSKCTPIGLVIQVLIAYVIQQYVLHFFVRSPSHFPFKLISDFMPGEFTNVGVSRIWSNVT